MAAVIPFDPLARKNLGESISAALLGQVPEPLGAMRRFLGAGVYVLYYTGMHKPFAAYESLARRNRDGRFELPIYVGKSDATRTMTGMDVGAAEDSPKLYERLQSHRRSIERAESTLSISDFYCRCLLVQDIWIPLGESLMIAKFSPVWNSLIRGFGNNAEGGGRADGAQSLWDTLHPGRRAVGALRPRTGTTPEEIAQQVVDYLRARE
jgi:hypothetical protein